MPYTPFPHYINFTWTKTIPELYWNTYSQEEGIKNLACEYQKLIEYVDSMVDTINAQYEVIEKIDERIAEYIEEELEKTTSPLKTYINTVIAGYLEDANEGSTYNDLHNHPFLYKNE